MPDVPNRRLLRPFLAILPQFVREHLFSGLPASTHSQTGLGITVSLLGESEISLLKLFEAAREALRGGGEQRVRAANDREIVVRAVGTTVQIVSRDEQGEKQTQLMPLSLLAEDRSSRTASFHELIVSLHGALDHLEVWRQAVDSEALSDDQMLKLFDELNDAPISVWSRLRSRVVARRLGVDDIVPTTRSYYCAVLGDSHAPATVDEYLREIWPEIVRHLLAEAPGRGARLLLPLAVDPAFYLSSHLAEQPEAKAEILATSGALDLGSRLGLLEIVCTDLRTSQQVAKANELTPTPNDDAFALQGRLLAALTEISYARLLEAPDLVEAPDYWRRMCAWWNAGHVARVMQEEGIDAAGFVEWLESVINAEYAPHSIVRLARAPNSAWSRPKAFLAEPFTFGRIAASLSRQRPDFEDAARFVAAVVNRRDELIGEGHACEPFVPGPIVLTGAHAVPAAQEVDSNNCDEIERHLAAGELIEWRRLGYMSQCLAIPDRLRVALSEAIDRHRFPTGPEDRRESFDALLDAGLLAARLRDPRLSRAVLAKCRLLLATHLSPFEARELVVTGFFATASEDGEDVWLTEYGKFLHLATSMIVAPESVNDIAEIVSELARLIPPRSRHFSQAQAVLSLVRDARW